MSDIPTWHERAMRHPNHQSGMISEEMVRARMGEEIADLRAAVERLIRERDEAQAEVESLREVIRTIRVRYNELYDSDAVSETFDIANADLDSKP